MYNAQLSAQDAEFAVEIDDLRVSFPVTRGALEVLLTMKLAQSSIRQLRRLPVLHDWLARFEQRKVVLDEVSLKIRRGSTHVIVGLNGAGKSTLLYCLSNLLRGEEGSVRIFGRDLARNPAIVGQCVVKCSTKELNPEFTALENIEFLARLYQVNVSEARETASLMLERFGVRKVDYTSLLTKQLSLGTKGKVALVRALVVLLKARRIDDPPQILVLDEPTGGFDVIAVKEFFEMLTTIRTLVPDLTVIIGTNDPRELSVGDDCTVISGGTHTAARARPELIQSVRESVSTFTKGLESMERIIAGNGEHAETRPPIATLKRLSVQRYSVLSTISWRSMTDTLHGWPLIIMVLVGLIVPQLLAVFSGVKGNGYLASYLAGMLGVFISLLTREYMRPLERERGWFASIETVMTSPASLPKFWMNALVCGTIVQSAYAFVASAILFGLLSLQAPEELTSALAQMSAWDALGIVCVLLWTGLTCLAAGLTLSFLPFIGREDVAFFVTGIAPSILMLFSGVYYPPETMPGTVQYFIEWNPLTSAAEALLGFAHVRPVSMDSNPWASVQTLAVLSIGYFVVAVVAAVLQFVVVRNAGRMRKL